MNWATAIVLLVVAGMVVLAILTLRKGKGGCACGGNGKPAKGCSSCASCTANCPLRR